MPAIRMEEITPITMSDASKLAPEEIFEKQAKFAQGETEKTKEDRKKDRKEKKRKKEKRKGRGRTYGTPKSNSIRDYSKKRRGH